MAPEWTPSPIGFAELCSSNPERVGRDGFLGLRFERRLGRTILAQCRFKLPLQALTPTELADGTAYLMLLNPTGGLVGGDFLLTQIIQEAGTRVCLTTPSATRVYRTRDQAGSAGNSDSGRRGSLARISSRSRHPPSGFEIRINRCASRWAVAAARSFGMPWRQDAWRTANDGISAKSIRASEISLCGRGRLSQPHSEFVRPASIPSDWDSPKDSTTWQRLSLWRMNSNGWKETVAAMDAELRNMPQIYGGASALASGGCVVKLLARSASDLMCAQAALWGRARQIVFGSPAIDLRKY